MSYSELLFTASTAAVRVKGCGAIIIFGVWGKEFINRETYSLEGVTRILGVARAFLCWNTEIISRNKHLHISFKLNYCENTKSDLNNLFAITTEVAFKAIADVSWNCLAVFAQCVTAVTYSANLCIKNNRVNALYFLR